VILPKGKLKLALPTVPADHETGDAPVFSRHASGNLLQVTDIAKEASPAVA